MRTVEYSCVGTAGEAPRRRFRIASYPDRNPGNPYIERFYQALASHGIEHAGRVLPTVEWLSGDGRGVDIVHIHWPERIWRGRRSGRLERGIAWLTGRSIRGVLKLRRLLDEAAKRGVLRVWTVHNIEHHEGTSAVDRWGYRVLARHCDLLLCFSHSAAADLRRAYATSTSIVVIPVGTYEGVYPPPRDRDDARAHFGLRCDLPVVSCLGLLRPYKGIDTACEAVRMLDGAVQLLVAGQPNRQFELHRLFDYAAASRGHIVVRPRALTDSEFADAMAATDAVLLPYRTITGSSVLYAAWTMGVGVIASDLPFFCEVLDGAPLLGRTFRAGNAADLANEIRKYLSEPIAARQQAIAAAVEQLAPERIVVPFVEAIHSFFQDSAFARDSET